MAGRRVNIWIREDNLFFWDNLDNKSGWLNYMIEQFMDTAKKQQLMEEKYEQNEKAVVQNPSTPFEG